VIAIRTTAADTRYPLKRSRRVLKWSCRNDTTTSLDNSNIAAIPIIDQEPPENNLDIPNTE
jgi:hypothetical protein